MRHFSDANNVSDYAARTARIVPGLTDMHKMAALLLAERADARARILVLGAGGGMELAAFAAQRPDWGFCGVDPSAGMLDQARERLGRFAARVDWHQGYIETAPEGPFDGAACLLVLHFLRRDERLRTLQQVHRRLSPGSAFVVAHHSFASEDEDADRWLSRYAAFVSASDGPGGPDIGVKDAIAAMKARLPVLSPEEDAGLLKEAGFADVDLFYAGFTFRGWVCRRD